MQSVTKAISNAKTHLPAKSVVVVGGRGAVEHLPVAVLDLHSCLELHRRNLLRVAVAHLQHTVGNDGNFQLSTHTLTNIERAKSRQVVSSHVTSRHVTSTAHYGYRLVKYVSNVSGATYECFEGQDPLQVYLRKNRASVPYKNARITDTRLQVSG